MLLDVLKKRFWRSKGVTVANTARNEMARHNPHPNEVDCKRIERALQRRKRYRYVAPAVRFVPGGYYIESPCCSRNIDADGGVIGVAQLEYLPAWRVWRLFRRDHTQQCWIACADFPTLGEALDLLNADPQRMFWP